MKIALIILQMFPMIVSAIKSLEEIFPVAGAGKEKLEIIKTLLEGAYGDIKEIWPIVEKLIAKIVAAANALGVFNKST